MKNVGEFSRLAVRLSSTKVLCNTAGIPYNGLFSRGVNFR